MLVFVSFVSRYLKLLKPLREKYLRERIFLLFFEKLQQNWFVSHFMKRFLQSSLWLVSLSHIDKLANSI